LLLCGVRSARMNQSVEFVNRYRSGIWQGKWPAVMVRLRPVFYNPGFPLADRYATPGASRE
jgi:hypothetical protein